MASIRKAWDKDGICIWTDDASSVEILFITVLGAPEDPVVIDDIMSRVRKVYELNPHGFGMVIDLRGVQLHAGHLSVAMKFGRMFKDMDQTVRARASRGVFIVTESPVVCEILNTVVSMFPSPVPVSSTRSMETARALVTA